jgi:hypothetical protein
LNRNLTNEQVKKINDTFLQIAGTNGQMLILVKNASNKSYVIEDYFKRFFSAQSPMMLI